MKVKATINKSEFEISVCENIVRFNAVFAVEKGVKVDFKNFQNIEFDIPIINELEKYSDSALEEELLRRAIEGKKPRASLINWTTGVTYCPHCGKFTTNAKFPE